MASLPVPENGSTPSDSASNIIAGTFIVGCFCNDCSVVSNLASPFANPYRCLYECTTTSTKSGLLNETAVDSKVSSSNFQVGDQLRHNSLHSSFRYFVNPMRPRSLWK